MDVTTPIESSANCQQVSEILGRIGDKWTVLLVRALHAQPHRFGSLKRRVNGISQQMLTRSLKTLERDGIVVRTVHATNPPQVEYALTALGHSLSAAVKLLADWALANHEAIRESRTRYDSAQQRPPA